MALADYWKGPEHRAQAERLERELKTAQSSVEVLLKRCQTLEEQMRSSGILSLLEVQQRVRAEESRLAQTTLDVVAAQGEVAAAHEKLRDIQKEILVAEDTVELESFALYVPKYQFTNSSDYKSRLDEIRDEQKESAKRLSQQVASWDHSGVTLTKANWMQLRKDVLKLALRAFAAGIQ